MSYVASLRKRTSIQTKLPILHSDNVGSGTVTPPGTFNAAPDLAFHSPFHVSSFLRVQVLAYLADLESHLSSIEPSTLIDGLKGEGEMKIDEAMAWVKTGLEMLEHIRVDVSAHLLDHANDGHLILQSPTEDPTETEKHSHSLMGYIPKLSEHLHSLQAHLSSFELPHRLIPSSL